MAATDSPDPQPDGALQSLDDKALVQEIVGRRPEAVAELYDRYSGMLKAMAQRILHDPSDAEEILQETFLQVWNQASRYDPRRSSVSTWLVLIARSRSIDRLRSQQVKQRTATAAGRENPDIHTSPRGVGNVLGQERRKRLREEMAKLPSEQSRVLELAFYGGMTQSEIAEQTGIPLGTVKTRTLLAMKKLRQALRNEIKELL
jgi:RNA polymerase sigma-70 factor (ECF subfamily)